MNKWQHTKIVREGQYVAEVELELIDTDEARSPYLSLEIYHSKTPISSAMFAPRSVVAISRPPRGWDGFLC